MAHAFIPVERDQTMLLPPDLRDWLAPDHLAWFVLDSVELFDLSDFYTYYRTGAQGRAAYDPKMMVAILLYAYATGIRSSRDIERRLQEDVAFRVIAANRNVDHATICRFRRAQEDALSELFVQVVGLCVRAGMVKTTIVAIDGTKIAANASGARNLNDDQLKRLAAEVFEEAERIDAEEDRLYGDKRGDEIPEHLLEREARLEWLRQQLGERKPPKSGGVKRINTTDPDSRVMKAQSGYLQGFNAQLAVSDDHVIVAADLSNEASDVTLLQPMIEQAQENLEATGAEEIDTIVADAGYLSATNVNIDTQAELLIAPTTKGGLEDALQDRCEIGADHTARASLLKGPIHDDERRREVIEAYIFKQITASEAASTLLAPIGCVYHWAHRLRKFGCLPQVRTVRQPQGPSAKEVMLERFADPQARATYKRRAAIAEPLFGQLKELRGLRRFLHRGLPPCRGELRLMATAQNVRRVWSTLAARNLLSDALA